MFSEERWRGYCLGPDLVILCIGMTVLVLTIFLVLLDGLASLHGYTLYH